MQQPEHVKGTSGRSLSRFPTPFFYLLSDYFVRLCVRPSVRTLVLIPDVSVCLSVCLSAYLYTVQNSINADQIFT
jgi:hypothetical protein